MSNGTKVKKRNGSIEPLDLEKMHLMVEKACEGLGNVSSSQVEIQSVSYTHLTLPTTPYV